MYCCFESEVVEIKIGGNGISGYDEMSELFSFIFVNFLVIVLRNW